MNELTRQVRPPISRPTLLNQRRIKFSLKGRSDQQGMALVMVLLILGVVMLLGTSSASVTVNQTKSARYDRDYQVAWESAEAALQDAEFDIRGPNAALSQRMATFDPENVSAFVSGCGSGQTDRGLCLPTEFGKPAWALVDFMDTSSSSKTVAYGTYTGQTLQIGSGVQPARLPRYVIEVFDFPSGSKSVGIDEPDAGKLYRVTAIGFGPTTDTQVVMQMEFRKDL